MDDYLSKPFKQDEVFTILDSWSHVKSALLTENASMEETKGDFVGAEMLQGAQPEEKGEKNSMAIDRSVLNTLRDLQVEGKPDILGRIINAYLNNSAHLIAEMQEALTVDDHQVLQNAAHSLKSSSANVGAVKLSGINKELEMGCENGPLGNAANLVSAIESEFISVKDALSREIQQV